MENGKVMSNPHNFVIEAHQKNIRPEYLIEAKLCIGAQSLARMFSGVSSRGKRGCMSAITIDAWLNTFDYAENNPDIKDNDQYTARRLEPTVEYYDYIELIKKPIDDVVVESWNTKSSKKLSEEAALHGITLGIKNSKAIETLLQRMLDMVERRRNNIWNKTFEIKPKELDYRMMNVHEIRRLLKERNIRNAHITKKEDLINLLIENPTIIPITEIEYEKLTIKDLKSIAKDIGLTKYNKKITKTRLITLIRAQENILKEEHKIEDKIVLTENDKIVLKEEDKIVLKEDTVMPYNLVLKDGTQFVVPFRKDGMVNATMLCKAGKKRFNHWNTLESTKDLIKALESRAGIPALTLIDVKNGGNNRDSWIHRKLAYHLAMWISPDFGIQVSNILDTLFTTGEVKLQRPLKKIIDLSQIDIEAEILETRLDLSLYTNAICLYVAYIGNGLVKIGYSDGRIETRINKHESCESEFEMFRMIKIFKISSRTIEKKLHELLSLYRVVFNKQLENFKPKDSLQNFIDIIDNLLKQNDLKFQLELLERELMSLKLENMELKMKLLKNN